MTRSWVPDSGWTGDWSLPPVLSHRVSERERGMLVAFSCAGVGPARLASLLEKAGTIDEAAGCIGLRWRESLAYLKKLDARALVPSDAEYPPLLREIAAPPPLLYVSGRHIDRLQPCVAVVGARACTSGAKRFAARLGEALATAGFTVVSGLARGIDGSAHEGALEAGKTIAVLGTGLDVVYPAEHRDLATRIRSSGAIVTEFPPGIGPRAWHFPARNRIISGLSIALVVVEAGLGSGALISAEFAMNQGREIFACTTGPENPAGAGTRAMLKDCARLIVDAEQAVEDLVGLAKAQGYETSGHRLAVAHDDGPSLEGADRLVYDAVGDDTTVEHIAEITSLPPGRVAAVLTALELDGLVAGESGRWRRS